jgi:cation diffusion facilitator CzcD-associated flavoprotein CzcO
MPGDQPALPARGSTKGASTLRNTESDLSIIIIGAGFGGIGAAVTLQQSGFNRITILDKNDGVGGTWWENRYPGAETDTPSVIYSYSFRRSQFTRSHARQSELLGYLEEVAEENGLKQKIRLNTKVEKVEWREGGVGYRVVTRDGRTFEADVVISAVGLLNDINYPNWPGLETFKGPVFHTARWESHHDLSDKTVGIVGSGSTAVQLVPELAQTSGRVMMFQREPGWIVPKNARELSDKERAALKGGIGWRRERFKALIGRQLRQFNAQTRRPGTPENLAAQSSATARIKKILAGRPDLIDAVTPQYPFGGKRQVLSDGFYETLLKPNVTLIPRAVVSVTEDGVVDATGTEHKVDILILATGFKPANFLSSYEVVGPDGRTIHEVWDGEPNAFLGIMVHGFPNFFMLYGPNTNGGAIVTHMQMQSQYIVSALKKMLRKGAQTVQVKPRYQVKFNEIIQKRLKGTAWEVSRNYFKSASGRIVTQWPDGVLTYALCTLLLRGLPWEFGRAPRSADRSVLAQRDPAQQSVPDDQQEVS